MFGATTNNIAVIYFKYLFFISNTFITTITVIAKNTLLIKVAKIGDTIFPFIAWIKSKPNLSSIASHISAWWYILFIKVSGPVIINA